MVNSNEESRQYTKKVIIKGDILKPRSAKKYEHKKDIMSHDSVHH